MVSRLRRILPRREQLLASRWLRPVAHRLEHPSLWHFNRRSIARGVALGLFAGFLLPLGQIVIAALLSLSIRANVMIAAGATLVTNPLTFPPIYVAAYRVGHGILGEGSSATHPITWQSAAFWMRAVAAPTALGLLLFALVAAISAYIGVMLAWRWRVGLRWRRRLHSRARFAHSIPSIC